jgi:hypothetical protein
MGPQAPRKPLGQANSNRSPRYLHKPRTEANTGENPGKWGVSAERVRSCSRLLVGSQTAKGPQREQKGTAKRPQALPPKRPRAAVR